MRRFLTWRSRKSLNSSQQTTKFPETTALILGLPTEILALIVSHLNDEFALAFSLTCKHLYNIFFVSLQAPYADQRINNLQLLRLLERDTADYLLCSSHSKLYAWRKQKSNLYQCRKCRTDWFSATIVELCGTRCGYTSSRFMNDSTRSLMLRHAVHGPQFGIQASRFNHVCSTVGESHNKVELKIVDQKLMVRRTLKVLIIMDHMGNLVRDSSYLTLCPHNSPGYHSLFCAAVEHVSAAKKRFSKSNQWSCPLLFKCKQCATDVKLSINQGSRRTAAIEFDVYQDLGGLFDMSEAQCQVLRKIGNIRSPSEEQQIQRLREDLTKQFHSDKLETPPKGSPDRTFLDQWGLDQWGQAVDTDRWAFNFADAAQLTPVWSQYRTPPFELLKG